MNKTNKSIKTQTKWNMTPDEIINNANKIVKKSQNTYDILSKITINDNEIHKFILMMSDDLNEFNIFHSMCGFLQYVSPNEKIRKAGYLADLILSKYINESNTREDIYGKLILIKNMHTQKHILNDIDSKFIEKIILNFQRHGILLVNDNKQLLLKINHEISKLENSIIKFISESEYDNINLTVNELDGVPLNIINTYNKISSNPDIFEIQFNKINYGIFMKYINDGNTRKTIESFYSKKYNNIFDHLSKLLVLRDKRAKILSYNCHSDFKSHIQMTKNSDNIKKFLTELLYKLDFRYKRELDTIIKIANKYDNGSKINSWDIQYYITKWKQEYGINENTLKEYFELNNTLSEIFKIYEKIFNIKFVKSNSSQLWSNNIDTYFVMDNGETVGHFYLDLYCRNGKYKQTRCFGLQPATLNQLPIVTLIASFQQNNNNIVLLNFQDVISLFHETTHVIHHIFGKTKHSIFSGLNVEIDFVETPAQMLDLLCWEKNIIKQLSKHYETGKQLQDDLINKLIKLKNLDIGIYYKRHILVALFDQIIYSSEKFIETCENILEAGNSNQLIPLMNNLYNQLHEEIMGSIDNNSKYKINLNNDIGLPIEWISTLYGTDSQYYCSIWSRVLSSDMYNEKIKDKLINSDIGSQFKKCVLTHGGTKSAYDMICDYMNRKPAIDGFIAMHDLDVDMEYSFFLNTDQIKDTSHNINTNKIQEIHKPKPYNQRETQNKQKQKYNDYIDSVSNKFSEINESSINMDDFEHQTEDMRDIRDAHNVNNKFKKYDI